MHAAVRLPERSKRFERRERLCPPRAPAPRHAGPGDRERRVEFVRVLRMNAGALLERQTLSLGRSALAHGSCEIQVITDEHSFALFEAVRWIDDLSDFLVRPRPAAVDLIVLFPEAAFELQPDLAGAGVRCRS